ncbi:MAG: glycosyltransferase [Bacteroidetes bacterium]|nr:glycosyltransferase [Bacteroidota bacterium]MBU1372156.1 glycosyltransferase [Bacteroidota bacterium]MBU1483366.1 glycosyltransferase [Bacteroidota bacterium]MBU1759447.1 glycosyltransferase [Bacteroidota bacterium]MBU2045738.1 glycosyltransferase [Bacteroidota bacterium]
MLKKDYVLVVPSWYPSKKDVFNGDFNERTISALSNQKHQVIVYLVGDSNIKKLIKESNYSEYIDTIIGYYPKSTLPIIGNIFNLFYYLFYNLKFINQEINERGLPIYIHTYVFFPAGLVTMYYSKKYKLKSVLTEHWTAFYDFSKDSLSSHSILLRFLFKRILNSFDLILPVAKALEVEVKKWNKNTAYKAIPNVMNTNHFNLGESSKYDEFTFLHVSTLSFQKNPELLLEAFDDFLISNPKVKLNIIGPQKNHLVEKVKHSVHMKNAVRFLGEMNNHAVAEEMKKCHAFVLNSRYENLPCVILEALCCGLPVISTDVGGVSEILNQENGLLFSEGNKEELIKSLHQIYKSYKNYKPESISELASKKYSYQAVANETWRTLKINKICS